MSDATRLLRWALLTTVVGCGGLERSPSPRDGGVIAPDSGSDAQGESSPGASFDASADASSESAVDVGAGDASHDASPDASSESAVDAGAGDASDDAPTSGCSSQGPVVLVSNVYFAQQVAVDAANVYFSALDDTTEADAVYQIAKGVAGATPLQLSDGDRQPYSFATDGSYLYWNDTLGLAGIRRIAAGGDGATLLLAVDALGVALGPTSLFWVTASGSVQSMPKAGGAVQTLGTEVNGVTWGVAIDASYFYFAATASLSATISRVPLSGGPVTDLVTVAADVTAIAVDAANVYFVDGDALSSVPVAGGTSSVIANGFSGTMALKADSGNVYASISLGNGPTGSVVRIPVTGGPPTVLAGSQWIPSGLALDATCVYWADADLGGGTIMAAAK